MLESFHYSCVALFQFLYKIRYKIYQTFAESKHMACYFLSGSATPGSRVQARVMTLWVGVTFILAFAIVATLDVNIHKSKQLGAFWVLPELFHYIFVVLFSIFYESCENGSGLNSQTCF